MSESANPAHPLQPFDSSAYYRPERLSEFDNRQFFLQSSLQLVKLVKVVCFAQT